MYYRDTCDNNFSLLAFKPVDGKKKVGRITRLFLELEYFDVILEHLTRENSGGPGLN